MSKIMNWEQFKESTTYTTNESSILTKNRYPFLFDIKLLRNRYPNNLGNRERDILFAKDAEVFQDLEAAKDGSYFTVNSEEEGSFDFVYDSPHYEDFTIVG